LNKIFKCYILYNIIGHFIYYESHINKGIKYESQINQNSTTVFSDFSSANMMIEDMMLANKFFNS